VKVAIPIAPHRARSRTGIPSPVRIPAIGKRAADAARYRIEVTRKKGACAMRSFVAAYVPAQHRFIRIRRMKMAFVMASSGAKHKRAPGGEQEMREELAPLLRAGRDGMIALQRHRVDSPWLSNGLAETRSARAHDPPEDGLPGTGPARETNEWVQKRQRRRCG
jgi:hypothetical protein